ncbi:unnamed protein product, partial [marine sediment metagenome]
SRAGLQPYPLQATNVIIDVEIPYRAASSGAEGQATIGATCVLAIVASGTRARRH